MFIFYNFQRRNYSNVSIALNFFAAVFKELERQYGSERSFHYFGGGLKIRAKIPNVADNVLGFTAKGTVNANDYDAIIISAV